MTSIGDDPSSHHDIDSRCIQGGHHHDRVFGVLIDESIMSLIPYQHQEGREIVLYASPTQPSCGWKPLPPPLLLLLLLLSANLSPPLDAIAMPSSSAIQPPIASKSEV